MKEIKPVNVSIANGGTTGWTKNDLPLIIKGQDIYSGLASMKVEYSSDNSTWTDYKMVNYAGSTLLETVTSISANKNGYYRVVVTDQVGYETTTSFLHVTNIDQLAPTLIHTIDGDLRKNGWYRGNATLNLTASDTGGANVKAITVNGDVKSGDTRIVSVTNEGENLYNCYATDYAGNSTDPPKKITVKVDKTNPIHLSMTLNTTEWTKDPVIITVKAEDEYSGVDTIELQYTKDKDDDSSWTEYKTEILSGVNQASREIPVTDNGYYRIVVTDNVGFQSISSEALKVDNYDNTDPDANTIGIEKDTIQWVNEQTGVEVTSYGSDELSGLNTIEVLERNESGNFVSKKLEKFYGETTVQSTDYDTYINEFYKTKVSDQAGNVLVMEDKDAIEVDNIDPEAPTLVIESISSQEGYISTSKGYIIQAAIEDDQSGYSEAVLQKLNEAGEWEDTDTEYKLVTNADTEDTEEKESEEETKEEENPKFNKVARKRVLVTALSISNLAANKSSEDKKEAEKNKTEEVRKQGENTVIIEYTVRENGTYRLKGADLVQNTAYTNDTIEINNLDGSMPEIKVEGNPTIWQNKDASIKVSAFDQDSKITKMILDGKEQEFTANEEDEFYFTFHVTKNQNFSVIAYDEAGNASSQIIQVTKIDKDLPTLSIVMDTGWNQDGYQNMNYSGADELSGIAEISIEHGGVEETLSSFEYEKQQPYTSSDYRILQNGEYVISIKDHAGNSSKQSITETEAKILKAIEVMVPPEKTTYYEKENFEKKGWW